jgi:hypothetical protein
VEVAEPVGDRVVVVVGAALVVVAGVVPVVVVCTGGGLMWVSVVLGPAEVGSGGAGWSEGPPTLSVCVMIGCPPPEAEVVDAARGGGVAETADVERVVDIAFASVDLRVRVASALDRVDDDVITPPDTALSLDVLTVPVCGAVPVDALAGGDGRRTPGARRAPSAAAVDAPAVRTPTAAAEPMAIRDRRSSNQRRFGVPTERDDRRLIDGGGSKRTGGSGEC